MTHNCRTLLNFRFRPSTIAVALLIACSCWLGCSDSPRRPGPSASDYKIPDGEDDGERQIPKIARTFEHYESLAAAISECTEVELYEGLPHPTWESELLKQELEENEVVDLVGWPFYSNPVELSTTDAERLRKLYCTRSSFVPFGGWKACGGYHPDWCLKWKNGDDEFLVEICLGCSEMKTSSGRVKLHCDIWDTTDFESILKPYQKQRPEFD